MKIFTLFFSILLISLYSYGQQSNAPKAKLAFDKTSHDFGTIKKGNPAICTFKVINNGKIPLVLSDVTASCDCTTPSWPKNPIMPGDYEEIEVKYDTKKAGVFNKTVTVTSNAAGSPHEINISGEVIGN
jgi:hypothetical protein